MTLFRKIINWFINLIKRLFKSSKKNDFQETNKKSNKKSIIPKSSVCLPNYVFISDGDKEKLIDNIILMKNTLEESQKRIQNKAKIDFISKLDDKWNIKVSKVDDYNSLELLIKEFDDNIKKEIINEYNLIYKNSDDFKYYFEEIDEVIRKIKDNNISIITQNDINHYISDIVSDKQIDDTINDKLSLLKNEFCYIIDNSDNSFLKRVMNNYQKVNYVTISTIIIDDKISELRKIQDDFKKHRFNKSYYEKKVSQIKTELNQIKNMKNKKEMYEHITNLRKELYTKSIDKYDLLYNNEIFIGINEECDILLNKLNAKVIDLKNNDIINKKVDEEKEKRKKYINNIILRFQDIELARKIILSSKENDDNLIRQNEIEFIDDMYIKFNNGLKEQFNFERNKQKTELVILYNELNMLLSKEKKEPFVQINHINFRMEDLVEAIEVKKNELKNYSKKIDINEDNKLDNKIKKLVYKSTNKNVK